MDGAAFICNTTSRVDELCADCGSVLEAGTLRESRLNAFVGVCNLLTHNCLEGRANVALEPWEI